MELQNLGSALALQQRDHLGQVQRATLDACGPVGDRRGELLPVLVLQRGGWKVFRPGVPQFALQALDQQAIRFLTWVAGPA